MQANPTPTYYAPNPVSRKTLLLFAGFMVFLLLGAVAGYFVARSAVREATLNVQVTNDTDIAQDIRVLVNDDQVSVVRLGPGAVTSFSLVVGWTSTANGMFVVRAEPVTVGWSDSETKTVSAGQSVLVTLRVR